jgi:hypothetical protein
MIHLIHPEGEATFKPQSPRCKILTYNLGESASNETGHALSSRCLEAWETCSSNSVTIVLIPGLRAGLIETECPALSPAVAEGLRHIAADPRDAAPAPSCGVQPLSAFSACRIAPAFGALA